MIGFIDTLFTHTTRDYRYTALSLIYTIYSTPLNTHYGSQFSLAVSWQRIYNSFTVTSNHGVIPFLVLVVRLPIPNTRLHSIPLLPSSSFYMASFTFTSRDCVVGIATGYELDDRGVGVRVPVGARNFTFPC
jgi:hypothetical protein